MNEMIKTNFRAWCNAMIFRRLLLVATNLLARKLQGVVSVMKAADRTTTNALLLRGHFASSVPVELQRCNPPTRTPQQHPGLAVLVGT